MTDRKGSIIYLQTPTAGGKPCIIFMWQWVAGTEVRGAARALSLMD